MADRDIIQGSLSQLGQSQGERAAPELETGFVAVDERSPEELLDFTQRFADLVNHYRYDAASNALGAAAGWRRFFDRDAAAPGELLSAADGTTPAQLALFLSFLRLYELPRATLNQLTDAHLRFQFERVLGFQPRPAIPDRAHVVFELKKNTNPFRLLLTHELSAKKDETGVERVYQPVRESVINHAKVEGLRTILVDDVDGGTLRIAPVASSADGLGAPLPAAEPHFAPFGTSALAEGRIGFAIASPVLRMAEGARRVTLELELGGTWDAANDAALGLALECFVSGEKGWLGPYNVSLVRLDATRIALGLSVGEDDGAVVDYAAAIHGQAFAAAAPVLQVHLRPHAGVGFDAVSALTLSKARVLVSVSGLKSVLAENDAGKLDPKRPFNPFGTQPIAGSCFFVGSEEVLSKALTSLRVNIEWHGVPPDWSTHYADYGSEAVDAARFTARAVYRDDTGTTLSKTGVRLFEDSGATVSLNLDPSALAEPVRRTSPSQALFALRTAGSVRALETAEGLLRASPVLSEPSTSAVALQRPLVTLALEQDFLHATYRKLTLENALGQKRRTDTQETPIVLNEPHTPTVRALSLDYAARTSELDIASTSLEDFASPDVQFFHVDAFGQRRESGWLRAQIAWIDDAVPLFPPHPDEGELLVGVTGVSAGDSVSLLLQVAEGSADPEVEPPEISWSVLCDNHWKLLGADGLVLDTTNRLLRSGLVGVVLPLETTTQNTLLDTGCVWLKAAVARDTAATSRLQAVLANAAEVEFRDRGNDPKHLETPLPAGTITKLRTPVAAVKSVAQPYASFGGRTLETSQLMITRASERLRHKNRCITPWDHERVVLEAFPRVHKVKCLPHATEDGRWLAPGNVLLVVVPDVRNDNARNRLEPRTDSDTLESIKTLVSARTGMQVRVGVKNPTYQKVKLDFKVRFHRGYEPNEHASLLRTEITAFLSPWAFDAEVPISFGGVLYRSVLLNFVEERAYVDYVTDFKLFSYTADDASIGSDLVEVTARTPDAILVSDTDHVVTVLS